MRSVISKRSNVKSSVTVISNLEKQLREERQAREKLKEEIEKLKNMNSDLCNTILKSSPSKSKR